MAIWAFKPVAECRSCANNRGTPRNHSTTLTLSPPSGPLTFDFMEILGPLPKSEGTFAYILVIFDRFSKASHAVPIESTSARVVADDLLEYWVYAYIIPFYLLRDYGP